MRHLCQGRSGEGREHNRVDLEEILIWIGSEIENFVLYGNMFLLLLLFVDLVLKHQTRKKESLKGHYGTDYVCQGSATVERMTR